MKIFQRLGVKGQLTALNALFVLGLLIFGAVSYNTLGVVKMNGPLYQRLVGGKDLINDLCPPGQSVLEPYVYALQMLGETDQAKLDDLVAKEKAWEQAYQDRHDYWVENFPAGEVKSAVVGQAHEDVVRFFRIFNDELTPAVRAGELDKAKEIAYGPLTEVFASQRAESDNIVQMATERNGGIETDAVATISQRTWILMGICVGVIAIVSTIAALAARAMGKAITETVDSMEAATNRDYTKRVTSSANRDLGHMSSALNHLLDTLTNFEKQSASDTGQIAAIGKAQAVIEFNMDGTVVTANDNFLGALGYSLDEIRGQHHRMFCDPAYTQSHEYRGFWESLNRGQYQAAEYKRIGKGGKEVWIQASYNPILDRAGKPYKVVKYATDITAQVNERNAAVKLRGVVDNSEAAFMMVDRNFVVTYMNEQTNALLNKYADVFRSIWPKFDPKNILGQCIDQFHKDPRHQRNLLSDPSKLPHKADIQVGPMTFALTVTAQLDGAGNYVGNTLEWKNVTEERRQAARIKKVAAFQEAEVAKMSTVLSAVAGGDLTRNYDVASSDEDTAEVQGTFAMIARAVNSMCENLRKVFSGLTTNAGQLASTSTELSATSTQLAGGAEETTAQSATVAAAAEEMSTNMRNMAAATEQMTSNVNTVVSAVNELTSSIGEIAKTAEEAARIADTATERTKSSNETIGQLGVAAEEIGKVIEVIQDIAEQTNLLALNATIEAARAGEAGKGFAVVATEVKELARQTAGATEDIRNRIQRIQGSTGEAVRSIADVGDAIRQVNQTSATIASAVEEQSVITKQIAARVSQTAEAVGTVSTGVIESATACDEVARNIAGVDQASKQTSIGASQTHTVATELSKLSEELRSMVGHFQLA